MQVQIPQGTKVENLALRNRRSGVDNSNLLMKKSQMTNGGENSNLLMKKSQMTNGGENSNLLMKKSQMTNGGENSNLLMKKSQMTNGGESMKRSMAGRCQDINFELFEEDDDQDDDYVPDSDTESSIIPVLSSLSTPVLLSQQNSAEKQSVNNVVTTKTKHLKKKTSQRTPRPCMFCSSFQTNLHRHIVLKHKSEEAVQQALTFPKRNRCEAFDLQE